MRVVRRVLVAALATLTVTAAGCTVAVIMLGARRCGWCENEHP